MRGALKQLPRTTPPRELVRRFPAPVRAGPSLGESSLPLVSQQTLTPPVPRPSSPRRPPSARPGHARARSLPIDRSPLPPRASRDGARRASRRASYRPDRSGTGEAGSVRQVAPRTGWAVVCSEGCPPCPGRIPSCRGATPRRLPDAWLRGRWLLATPNDRELDLPCDCSLSASPPVHPRRVHSRGLPPFGIAVPPAILVPSSWFQPTSTVSSALRTPVYRNRRRTRFAAFPWGLHSDSIGRPVEPT